VRAHEWALRELTRNLLHNAIKHSPEGAALRIELLNDGSATRP
jgi:two-component system, OmpR family, sensor histidine kinase TctE